MGKEYLKKSTQKNIKSGIDTIGLMYNTDIDIKCFEVLKGALTKYTLHPVKGEIILVLKPSENINGGAELTDLKETMNFIELVEINFNLEKGRLKRVDFSVDMLEDYVSKKKAFRLILECLEYKRKGHGVYETKKPIGLGRSTGNLKIKSKRLETSFYDCSDKKNRIQKSRFENRILDIQTPEVVKKRIVYELKGYLKEFQNLEEYISIVEDKYINFLIEKYFETKGKNFNTFTEFIVWADYEGLILTERILKEVLKASGVTTRLKAFLREFRRLRPNALRFTNKTELKSIVKIIKKSLKKML